MYEITVYIICTMCALCLAGLPGGISHVANSAFVLIQRRELVQLHPEDVLLDVMRKSFELV